MRIRPLRVALFCVTLSACALVFPTGSYTDPLSGNDAGTFDAGTDGPGAVGAGEAGSCGATMNPPVGYVAAQLVFEDSFCEQIPDEQSKWLKEMPGFDNHGRLGKPYTAPNAGGDESEYFDPGQVVMNGGLRLTASPSQSQSGYTARSGVITTKQTMKDIAGAAERLYLQVRAKTTSKNGMWPRIYFGPVVGVSPNPVPVSVMSTGFIDVVKGTPLQNFLAAVGTSNEYLDTETDLSTAFTEFGIEIVWGKSVTWFWNRLGDPPKSVRSVQAGTNVSIPPSGENETLFIALSVINGQDGSSNWHTVWNGSDEDTFEVSYVRIYAR